MSNRESSIWHREGPSVESVLFPESKAELIRRRPADFGFHLVGVMDMRSVDRHSPNKSVSVTDSKQKTKSQEFK